MSADDPQERVAVEMSPDDIERLRSLIPTLVDMPDLIEGLRERKKLETRAELSFAAMRLALERGGLEDVRTDEIAEAAGYSPRTFNNYFRSPQEAIGATGVDRARRVALALADRPAGEPFAQAVAEAVVTEYTRGYEREPERSMMLRAQSLMMTNCQVRPFMLHAMTKLEDELTPVIAERLGFPADDLFPRVLAAAVNGAIRVATEYWLREDADTPYTALLRQAVTTAAGLAEHARPSPRAGVSPPEDATA
ncbi:MAG: TetR family transcriptional regulator [Catenulispora sp.]|nr:TetR family transcriptional regulator [Catenulispora sp.]